MKRVMGVLAATSLLTLSGSLPTAAFAATNASADGGVVAACKDSTAFPNEPPGNCVAIRTNASHGNITGAVPSICNFAEAEEPDLFYYFYASHADCVQDGASVFLS